MQVSVLCVYFNLRASVELWARQDVATTMQRRMHVASSVLIYLGSCLLALVVGIYIYGRFEAWTRVQPRELVSTQVLWPEVPPLTPLPSPTPVPSPTPTPTPVPGPPVRVEIPRLNVDRAVVWVGTVNRGGRAEWDANQLFATSSRRDLVGHLEGSANPGQPGNIILIGHNYNRGFYNWAGVFHSLHRLGNGDIVHLSNEDDVLFTYQVEQVDRVPVRARSPAELLTHIVRLSPTQDETLTLVTCGGANLSPFPSRIYVTAKRVFGEQ
jgi:LPXTG-site transpeptidase (sortase) family protein